MKNITTLFVVVLIIFIMVFSLGCVNVQEPKVTGYATMKSIRIVYDLDITITNPNSFDFTVSDIAIRLERVNGETIGRGTISGGTVPANSSKRFYGTLELGDNLLKAQNDEKVYLIVDATARGSMFIFSQEQKIHRKIEIVNPLKGKTQVEIKI